MKTVLFVLASLFIGSTLLPLLRNDHWTVRIFDFPRAQIAAGGLLVTVVHLSLWDTASLLENGLLVGLMACIVYQGAKMFPYTPLARCQVLDAERVDSDARFSLLIANVCVDNRDAASLRELVAQTDPDLVLTLEPDAWWEEQLRPLKAAYPHVVKYPLDNAYGMILHARLPLIEPTVRFIVEDDIPSIHAQVVMPSGARFHLHAVHPRPPFPTEDVDTTERDAELLIVGREAKDRGGPTLVAGDLNDVSWSYTTTLFQQISGLLDPRIGRGTYNTFPVAYPLLRYPLDHVFHSEHFKLVRLERQPRIGSDHFPVFIELQYEPEAPHEQDQPTAGADSREQVQREIDTLRNAFPHTAHTVYVNHAATSPLSRPVLDAISAHGITAALRNGLLRFAPTYYNTPDEMERILEVIEAYQA